MQRLEGLVPVLITPLNEDKTPDKNRLRNLTEHLCNMDIAGLWVLGTGSEDMSLTFQERLDVAETVSSANTKGKVIILGTSFFSHKEALNFMDETRGLEFDFYHSMPYHPLISHERISWIYEDLAEHASKPVWLYFSGNWSQTLPFDHIKRLSQHKNIGGVKYSSSNIVNVQKVATLNNENFQVITAVVRTLYSCLQMGVTAATTVDACAFAKPIIEIFSTFNSGNTMKARELQIAFNGFLDKFPKTPGADNFLKVAELKYILSKQDLSQEFMTDPYRGLSQEEKQSIDNIINVHKGWL